MYRAKLSARAAAPLLVIVLALVIGASVAQGASYPTDISDVSVSATMFGGAPAAVLTTGVGTPAVPTTIQLDSVTAWVSMTTVGFPAAGQVLIYDLDLKVGTKNNEELFNYDNSACVEGPNQLCITARAQGGTANVAHPAGSTVKLATQIVSGPDGTPAILATRTTGIPGFTFTVGSTDGFPSLTSSIAANILIDDELFEVHNFGTTTYHAAKRGVDTNDGNPTTPADHAVGAIVSTPDTYVLTMTRQSHNTGTNVVDSFSRPYTFLQPLYPVALLLNPFTPTSLESAPIKLKYTAGNPISTPGTYNPSNGILTIVFASCAWPGGDTDPPTTVLGGATLQVNKSGTGNQVGAFGSVRDTTHSAYSTLTAAVMDGTNQPAPFDMAVVTVSAVTGPPAHGAFAGSGQVLVGGELMTYSSLNKNATTNTLHVTSRGNGGTAAVAHAIGHPVIQTPVCDEQAVGAKTDVHVLQSGQNPAFDSDGDGCSNWKELNTAAGSQLTGGLRDPWNDNDYFNPEGRPDGSHGTPDLTVRVADILMVVQQYHKDDLILPAGEPPYSVGYDPETDRTALMGGNAWNLGPGNGQQRVDDILAVVKQFHHDC